MHDRVVTQHPPSRLQVGDDLFVGILDHHSLVGRNGGGELALVVNRVYGFDAVLSAQHEVVLTKGRRSMDDARSAVGRDEGTG